MMVKKNVVTYEVYYWDGTYSTYVVDCIMSQEDFDDAIINGLNAAYMRELHLTTAILGFDYISKTNVVVYISEERVKEFKVSLSVRDV